MKSKIKLLTLCAAACAAASAPADALRAPFESLPAETILAARFDNSSEALERYVETTQIGKLLLSDEKISEYKAFVQKLIDRREAQGGNLLQTLGELGLELDDIYAMITSEIGGAVVMQPVPGHRPMPTMLIWAEMEDGVADRAFQAILDGSAENTELERVDHEIAGAAGARIRRLADGSSFLIAKLENRFVFALGHVMEEITTLEAARIFEEAEFDALGYFLQAQQGEGGEFLSRFYAGPGVNGVRPSFPTRFEALGEVGPLLQFFPAQSAHILHAFEFNKFTQFAAWSGLVDREERSVLFLGAPSPRGGVAALMDGETFEFDPPAWVPAAVNTYSVSAFDWPKLFDLLVATAKKFSSPEMIEQQLARANEQLQGTLQTDVDTLLASFGKRLHIVEYPIEMVTVPTTEGGTAQMPKSPQVMVMDFLRPEILQAGLAAISNVANQPNSGLKLVDEQGFSGIRVAQNPQSEMTIAHGLGKIVLATGSAASANRIFSALTNLPRGEDALANDPELRRFLAESRPRPGIAFSFTRGEKILKNLMLVFQSLGKSMQDAQDEETAALFEEALALLPSEDELEGMLGVGFTRVYSNEHGLVVEGLNEYK